MNTISIKYLDKLNNIKNRYSIPYTQKNMKEEHYVELMYEELSIEMIKEIERLNNIINELNNVYCKVITKCEEMINNRFYMNDIAIKKYADEIKDICKYYVGEAK